MNHVYRASFQGSRATTHLHPVSRLRKPGVSPTPLIKLSLLEALDAHRVVRRRGSHIF
jgi:hypothetical protein